MQAPVPLICHLEQCIQTQGFPLDTEKSVIASFPSSSSLGEADQLDSQSPCQSSQSTAKKYDKWTNEQQRFLVQLGADKQDLINSKDSRNAWREIAEAINNKEFFFFAVDRLMTLM